MELCVGFCIRSVLLVIALTGYFVQEACSEKIFNLKPQKLLSSYKSATGHLHQLRNCRRQLTFIASAGLGSFITRIIKESPLTPLPMPPLKNPPRWNFLTLPLHFSEPYIKWMKGHTGKPQQFYKAKDFDYLPSDLSVDETINTINEAAWRRRPRYRRDLSMAVKPSPLFIAKTVAKAMKHLHSALLHHKGAMKWLMRWCG